MASHRTRKNRNGRWNQRPATISKVFAANRAARGVNTLKRGVGSRNLLANNKQRASTVVNNLLRQGINRRQMIVNTAKNRYGMNNRMLNLVKSELNAIGIDD
jgi:hypothetical protein